MSFFLAALVSAVLFLLLPRPRRVRAQVLPDPILFERLSTPLILFELQNLSVEKANPAFVRLFGREPATGETLPELLGPDFPAEGFSHAVEAVRKKGETPALPYLLTRKNSLPLETELAVPAVWEHAALLEVRPILPTPEDLIFGRVVREVLPGLLFYLDADGRLVDANNAICRLWGKPIEELRGKLASEAVASAAGSDIQAADLEVREKLRPVFRLETLPRHAGGEIRLETLRLPLFGSNGECRGVLGLGREVGEHFALMDAAEYRRTLFDSACRAVEVLLTGRDTPLAFRLDKALEMLGVATGVDRVRVRRTRQDGRGGAGASLIAVWEIRSSLRGRKSEAAADIIFDDGPTEWRGLLASGRCFSGLTRNMPLRMRKRLESQSIRSFLMAPIMLNDEFWGFIGFEDCARERVWSEEEESILRTAGTLVGAALAHEQAGDALRLSEERFRNVADASGEIIWEMGANERITFMSPRCFEVMGLTPEEMIGLSVEDIGVLPEFVAHFRKELQRQIAGQGFFRNLEHGLLDKFGNVRHLRTSGVPLYNALGEFAGIRATSVDVTAEKESARTIREALDALREANRELEQYAAVTRELAADALAAEKAKNEFLAAIGHEVRTPINVITGMAHLVLRTDLDTARREQIEKIHTAGMSLLRIMNNILDFADAQRGGLEPARRPLRPREIPARVIESLTPQAAAKGLTLEFEPSPDTPDLLIGDPDRLEQVFRNLLHNAVKFSERGVVRVECRPGVRREHGLELVCTVHDNGPGIPTEHLPDLFEPFFQLDSSDSRRHSGTGVGLALTKTLVEAMGGTIHVSSIPGRGTTFHFTVLLDYPPRDAVGESAAPSSASRLRTSPAPAAELPVVPAPEHLPDLCRLEALLMDDDAAAVALSKKLRPYLRSLPEGQKLLDALAVFDLPAALVLLRRIVRLEK